MKIEEIKSVAPKKEIKFEQESEFNKKIDSKKDIKPEKLIELIKDVMEGSLWYDPAASKILMKKTSKINKNEEQENQNKYNLTTKEMRVLFLLAEGNSNLEIARKMNISINTTKVHMCSILQKLSVDDRTQAAIKAIRENLT